VAASIAATATLAAGGCHRRATPVASVPPPPPAYAANTVVAGVAVAGLTQDAGAKFLAERLKPLGVRPLTLTYGSRSYHRHWGELGIKPNVDAMLASAWKSPNVPLALTLDMRAAKRSIRHAARGLDIEPISPHFVGPPSKGWIKPGRTGRRVDVYGSALLLQSAVQKDPGLSTVPLVVVPYEPGFTVEDLEPIKTRVVSYTTFFNPREANRTHNLRLVSRMLNGAFVKPGEVFSFNGWVGERNASDGFREAIVYKYGKMEKDIGGGLCQVSSTLYNVALLSGLPIMQRSHHSLTVHYVPLGRDATVYWGTHDLRFRNDTSTPLYIRTRVSRAALTIEAWGEAPLGRKVQVTSTADWSNGQAVARVYRIIAQNGQRKKEMISDDKYDTQHVMASVPAKSKRT
jgi:vancomycin resistance protein YoaR